MSTADERRELLSRWDDLPRPEGWNQGDEHHLACKVIEALRDLVDGSRLEGERARARTEITVTDEMVERVAAAMLEETYGSGAWASREPMEDVLYRRRARVAIVATSETNHTDRSEEEQR